MSEIIDIRSDTVTAPTPAMRKAMARAEVGDDVYGDDPTVNALEKLGAELVGKEAAVFVPSGTFGNQAALFTWCERGSEVILGEDCHILQHEAGAAAVLAAVQTRPINAPEGVLPARELALRLRKADMHSPGTSLICLENAYSGRAVPLKAMDGVRRIADQWKLPVHLDGARIFNAAAALGCGAADIAAKADSVMFCLSKGLCAPVGSLLAGTKEFVERARRRRKIMGGGMRQAGILAAAGIIALREHPSRLGEDHRRARQLEEALARLPGLTVEKGDINLVFFRIPDTLPVQGVMQKFRDRGIIINEPLQGAFRFALHYWIGDRELEKLTEVSEAVFGAPAGRKA
ncbi:MAG: low-specificity L-threonine aldolase [Spirochaetaceae bacterium]|nr:low-specificity L-threonine aldolase [Spirochaetaceae bacterium]